MSLSNRFKNWLDSDHKVKKLFVSFNYYVFHHKSWEQIPSLNTKEKFTEIYRNNLWNNEESRSGGGSTVARTSKLRSQLPELLREKGIRSMCDAGCGDFNWMKHVDLTNIKYLGVDIVGDMIAANNKKYRSNNKSFLELDVIRDVLPTADLILCRECLFHLSFEDIFSAILNFKKSGARYLAATHNPGIVENVDTVTGLCRRINFEIPPLNFQKPIHVIEENFSEQCLALWVLDEIDHSLFEREWSRSERPHRTSPVAFSLRRSRRN